MGNPIDDMAGLATGLWRRVAGKFAAEWHYMYNFYYESNFATAIIDAFTDLAVAFEYESVLAAVSDRDNVQIGRDAAWGTIENFRHLAWPVLPRWGVLAAQWADRVALNRARQAIAYAHAQVTAEHAAMERRVLQEELARLVEVADVWARLHTEIAIERNDRILEVAAVRAQLTALIAQTRQQILAFVDQVRAQLTQQIAQLSAYAHSIPGLVDQAAASGYDPTLSAHATTLTRLFDTAVAHDPLIAGVVGRLAGWLVDLAEVDNPLIRIAAQLILKEIINRFGLDTALGKLLGGLLGPVLGGGKPKTLAAVTAQIGGRLNGTEDGLAALAPLAPEADALHEMGTLAFDAALLGYLAAAVAAPVTAADDTAAALDSVVTPLLAPVRALLGVH